MRTLTVKRKWSIVECASRINLYVQCSKKKSALNIDGQYFEQYRLRNGKSVTVEISDEETVVFIESSTMRAAYRVAAGTEDVFLTAKPHYDPRKGNPFTIS